ncbi:hypothetical protein BD626DRAFT_499563, partial [Schizophyllum amplum]
MASSLADPISSVCAPSEEAHSLAFFARLPAEVVQRIFFLSLPPSQNTILSPSEAPLIYLRVCRSWPGTLRPWYALQSHLNGILEPHVAAQSEPLLTALEQLDAAQTQLDTDRALPDSDPRLLGMMQAMIDRDRRLLDGALQWLARSSGRPLSLSLSGDVHDALLRLVLPHRQRVRHLRIATGLSQFNLQPLRQLCETDLELLEVVYLTISDEGRRRWLFDYAHEATPNTELHRFNALCVRLQMQSLLPELPVLPWAQIKEFAKTFKQLLAVLPDMTAIEDLSLFITWIAYTPDSKSRNAAPIVLPRLRRLNIDSAGGSGSIVCAANLLEIITTPQLSDVTLRSKNYTRVQTGALRHLLERSDNSLRRLSVRKMAVKELLQVLHLSPELLHLHLEQNWAVKPYEHIAFARLLCKTLPDGSATPAFCPNLRTIALHDCDGIDGDSLVHFLEARMIHGASVVHGERLACEGSGAPSKLSSVDHGIEDRIAPFVSQGLDVTLSASSMNHRPTTNVYQWYSDFLRDGRNPFSDYASLGRHDAGLGSDNESIEPDATQQSMDMVQQSVLGAAQQTPRQRIGTIVVRAWRRVRGTWTRSSSGDEPSLT